MAGTIQITGKNALWCAPETSTELMIRIVGNAAAPERW